MPADSAVSVTVTTLLYVGTEALLGTEACVNGGETTTDGKRRGCWQRIETTRCRVLIFHRRLELVLDLRKDDGIDIHVFFSLRDVLEM